MANAHGDFIGYELLTSEPDAAQDFYKPLLRWTCADSGQAGIDDRTFTASDGAPIPPSWMGYVRVDDSDASAAHIRSAGGAAHMGLIGEFQFLRAGKEGGSLLGAAMTMPEERPMPGWTCDSRVPDIDTAGESLNGTGGRVINGPVEIPGGQFVLDVLDPQGVPSALIGARQRMVSPSKRAETGRACSTPNGSD